MAVRAGRGYWQKRSVACRCMVVACHIILLDACTLVGYSVFQVGGMGNCLYASVKKGLCMRVANNRSHPYYPTRYMLRQVVDWLVSNRQRVMMHKGPYLRETYGLADPTATFPQPFSYKQYCRQVLDKRFWGDVVILYAISCLWALKITLLNSQTLQEYRVRHGVAMRHVDIGLVFNGSCHYTAAGKHQCCLSSA